MRPRLYPVAKSPPLFPCPGISNLSLMWLRALGLVRPLSKSLSPRPSPRTSSALWLRIGLAGRLFCQNFCSSLPSSWPVVVQFVRMLSRISDTCRFRSSSFFLSHDTFSSCREVPRLNCRAMYFS